MENHVMEIIISIGAIATVGTNLLTFMETSKQFKDMRSKGNRILESLGRIIDELKD